MNAGLGQRRRLGQVLAHRARLGEQRRIDRLETRVWGRQRVRRGDLGRSVAWRLVPVSLPGRGEREQPFAPYGVVDLLRRVGDALELGPPLRCRLDAALERAGRVRLGDLHAPLPGAAQPLVEHVPAARRDHGAVVGAQRGVAKHGGMEGAEHRCAQIDVVLDQRHVGLQAERLQHLQRRQPKQLHEPGVEGQHRDRPPAVEEPPVERAQRGLEPHRVAGPMPRIRSSWMRASTGPHRHSASQPARRSRIAGGGACEGDGEDVMRLDAGEQQPDDARHQHPGLARPGAGLDHHARRRSCTVVVPERSGETRSPSTRRAGPSLIVRPPPGRRRDLAPRPASRRDGRGRARRTTRTPNPRRVRAGPRRRAGA